MSILSVSEGAVDTLCVLQSSYLKLDKTYSSSFFLISSVCELDVSKVQLKKQMTF